MKKAIFLLVFSWISVQLHAQNAIGIQAGFLGTHTSVAEYERLGRYDNLLDSVTISTNVGSVQAMVNFDVAIGRNLFLSPGFQYCSKGLADVTFIDSTGYYWIAPARQNYMGMSLLAGYNFRFKESKIGLRLATGLRADFAIGTPNPGTLFSGNYSRFLMPFSRFNETDLTWISEVGVSYQLGPGDIIARLNYLYGLSDVLEDAFVVGRSMSLGISVGYSFRLPK